MQPSSFLVNNAQQPESYQSSTWQQAAITFRLQLPFSHIASQSLGQYITKTSYKTSNAVKLFTLTQKIIVQTNLIKLFV